MSTHRRFAILFLGVLLAPSAFAKALRGRVLEDHSGNLLASVRVRVLQAGADRLLADLDTDANGRFLGPSLPEGECLLEVSKPNYAKAALTLRAEAGARPASELTVRLIKLGVITGQVLDAQNRPIRGAFVFPMARAAEGAPLRPLAHTTTDDRGQYRLFGLQPGEYAVAASLAGFRTGADAGAMLYPHNAQPRFFVISGGEEHRGVDFAIAPLSAHRVSGAVELSKPDSAFSVSLVPVDQPALSVAIRLTERDGTFQFEGIPPGSYHLFASGPVRGYGGRGALLDSEPFFGRMLVDVAGHDVEAVSVPAGQGRSASFVLHSDLLPGGCPPSATLILRAVEDWGARLERRVDVSFARESTVRDLAPARYELSVTKLGDTCFSGTNPVLDLTDDAPPDVTPVLVTPAGSIHGRLITRSASPGDFAVVLVASSPRNEPQPVRVAFADAEGRFAFEGLPPGKYRIAASPAAEASKARWTPDLKRMFEMEAPGGAPTEVDLPVAQ